MNATRRKEINKAIGMLEELLSNLETLRDEERDYYDNMPESLQNGDKGTKASECADALDSVCDDLTNVIDNLNQAVGD